MERSRLIQVLDCQIIVDADDFDFISKLGLSIVRRQNLKHVVINTQPYYKQYLHRVLLKVTNSQVVIDHINGNGLDNRKCNLRITNKAGNAINMQVNKNKKSGLPKGVYNEREGFKAQIKYNGLNRYLGHFSTVQEAEKAYLKEVDKFWKLHEEGKIF